MERIEKVLATRSRLQKTQNHEILNHRNGGWYLEFPGLKNDDFNRAGLPSVAKISRMGEVMRVTEKVAGGETAIDYSDPALSHLTAVVKGRIWTFTPQFYSRAAVKFPMTMHFGISQVGRTSFDMFQTFFADREETDADSDRIKGSVDTKEPIITCTVRCVCVSLVTRRPYQMTDDQIQLLSSQVVPGQDTFSTVNKPDRIPTDAFKWRVRVRHDDIDNEFHANQAAYLVYATECAAQAAHERYYSRIVEDVAFYPVKRAIGIYMDEALAGDELEVSTWEDDDDKMTINFVICKGQTVIYYAQLDFFDSVVMKSSL